MKFDPASRTLLTDDGRLIKHLSCHRRMRLEQLQPDPHIGHWHCAVCVHQVLDTAVLSEQELQAAVADNPGLCLLIRRGQPNVDILD